MSRNEIVVLSAAVPAIRALGVTAWIGFLVDVVLSAIVSNKLPIVLRDEVKKYLGQNQWVLMNLGETLSDTYGSGGRFAAPFDVDTNTILASIDIYRP
jgi:hypothetical protein